jgi:hypothetical protein
MSHLKPIGLTGYQASFKKNFVAATSQSPMAAFLRSHALCKEAPVFQNAVEVSPSCVSAFGRVAHHCALPLAG